MKEIRTEIEIEATPREVWQILTDLESWADWNPFIYHAVGAVKPGGEVDIMYHLASKQKDLHCKITKLEPNRELRWKYHVMTPGLFQGEHSFTIEPIEGDRVRFIDREVFNGLLVPLRAKELETQSKPGFEEMDKALKARVEKT